MGLSGSLRTMALSELLQWIGLGQKSGTVVLAGNGVEKKIFFSDGRILSSSSSDPREYLGHFLVSHGYITEEELRKAMEVQEESNILLGKILVMIDAISETDLMRLMRLKCEESIYEAFLWDDGDFRFDDDLPDMKMVPLSVDVTGIIMEGLRRWDEWKRIRERIPSNSAVPVLLGPVDPESLSELQKLILPYLNGRRSIEEIAVQTRNPEFNVAKLVYDLMHDALARLEEAAAAAPPVPETKQEEEGEITACLRRSRSAMAEGDPLKAWKTLRAALELEPSSKDVREAMRQTEQAILDDLAARGIAGNRVPVLKVSIGEVTQMNFSPNEGFILSRISGTWDIKSILKISPIRELEALLIFRKLLTDGIISLR